MLQFQNTILEMVAKGEALERTSEQLCLEVERRLPGVICSILRVELDVLRPLAAPSLPTVYSATLDGLVVGPGVGSCGSAAFLKKAVSVTDIESDPRWTRFKDLALPLGIQACWSSPICDGAGRVLGTFAFYFREKRGPSDLERSIVNTCVNLCAIALERHERVLERERRTFVDFLTGFPNRASFNAALSKLACNNADVWALLLLDVDNLKVVNDTFGHHAGDSLLQIVAARLAEAAAPHSIFRLGGDEFAVVIKGDDAVGKVAAIAANIRDAVALPADCDNHLIVPTATTGSAIVSREDESTDAVLRNADFALYHAKETDRGGYVHYTPQLGSAMVHRVNAIRDVALALNEDRIEAYYQPIFRLDTREVVGLEALCRLIRSDGEVVSASAFHEATSDARVASQLTRRMLTLVASDVRAWLEIGIPFQHVGVNVSSPDFHSGKLDEDLTEIFERENVSLEHVILEVTESVYMRRRDQVVAQAIKSMRAKGIRVALDDFGTGFASLTDLLTVPVDILKIDKSFVDRLVPGDASEIIVEGLIGIATKLGIRVVAEGIETEAQLAQLQDFGCTLGQGYLFSKAIPRTEVTALLLSSAQSPANMLRSIGITRRGRRAKG